MHAKTGSIGVSFVSPLPLSRRVLLAVSGLSWGIARGRPARAQGFPERPIRLIVPFAAGTSSDVQARLVAARLGDRLGQPFVVENRAGAGGTLGAEVVAKARPDGHTLLLGSNGPLVNNPVLQARMPYDAAVDFAPIALLTRSPLTLVVRADSPWADAAGLIAAARARPGEFGIGSSGQGSATHFLIEQMMAQAGIRLNHVPYRGSSLSVPDVLAGNLPVAMAEFSTVLPLWRDGLLRVLAVSTAARSALMPDVPTLIESGLPGLTGGSWAALATTAGTPPAAVASLAAAAGAALADPVFQARQAELGAQLATAAERTPAGFAAFLTEERARTRRTAELAGIRPD